MDTQNSKIKPALYLIPNVLAENTIHKVLPQYNLDVVLQLRHFVVENGKEARKFLRSVSDKFPLNECTFEELNEHSDLGDLRNQIKPLENGQALGLISDAGCPGIADPGAELVQLAHKRGYEVIPLVGPSSLLLALMASGFNGQRFAFHGYLPIDKPKRRKALLELEKESEKLNQSQLFIETPYRNEALFKEILATCKSDTWLSISCDLTSETGFTQSKSIAKWGNLTPDFTKRPCVFIVYRNP